MMPKKEININRLFLESGNDLEITKGIFVKHPKISDILYGGAHAEELYWYYIGLLLNDPYQNMVWLADEYGIDYDEASNFDVFCLKWNLLVKTYLQNKEQFDQMNYNPLSEVACALSFFLGEHNYLLKQKDDGTFILTDPDIDGYEINGDSFNLMAQFIELINGIDHANDIHPADKNAKKILLEQKRRELKRAERRRLNGIKEEHDTNIIGNMVASVIHGGNGSITPFNFKEAALFQIISAYKVIHKKFNVDHMLSGVYAGTLKKESLNSTSMSWVE